MHKINKLDTRIRLTFKDSIYEPSINVKTEKLSNCTIKSDKGHQTEDIYNYNQQISKEIQVGELQSLNQDLKID